MSEEKVKAVLKDIEGKAQEAAGEAADDTSMKVKGKLKQGEAEVRDRIAELKED